MQRSALLRAELEDAVAGMTPAARAVFEDIQRRDEDADPNLPQDFHALTPIREDERHRGGKTPERPCRGGNG